MACSGSGYTYHSEYRCGGPAERQCCAPAFVVTTTKLPETIPPTPTSPSTTASPSSAGRTAGIVIGVLVALGFVVGVGYFYRQNGNPLVAQQQSFNNLNNENNTEGVVDGSQIHWALMKVTRQKWRPRKNPSLMSLFKTRFPCHLINHQKPLLTQPLTRLSSNLLFKDSVQ